MKNKTKEELELIKMLGLPEDEDDVISVKHDCYQKWFFTLMTQHTEINPKSTNVRVEKIKMDGNWLNVSGYFFVEKLKH